MKLASLNGSSIPGASLSTGFCWTRYRRTKTCINNSDAARVGPIVNGVG